MARISRLAKQDGRRRLLETAALHFAHQGFEAASVDAIARDAGFAKGSVYNYFDSKAELFGEVITEACRRAAERYASGLPDGTLRERLTRLVRADVAVLREEEAFFRVLIREAMSFRPETYPLILRHLSPFLKPVEEALSLGVRRGEVRDDLPVSELALLFVGLLSLLYVQHWGSGGAWPTLERIPELAVTAFLDGAGRRPDARATKAAS